MWLQLALIDLGTDEYIVFDLTFKIGFDSVV